MKNELARELSLAEGKIQYDNSVKRVRQQKNPGMDLKVCDRRVCRDVCGRDQDLYWFRY